MATRKQRNKKKARITARQKSARRKNMAIARAARKSKKATFAKEYKRQRSGGSDKAGAIMSAASKSNWKHRKAPKSTRGQFSKVTDAAVKMRKKSFKVIKLPFDAKEAARSAAKWGG